MFPPPPPSASSRRQNPRGPHKNPSCYSSPITNASTPPVKPMLFSISVTGQTKEKNKKPQETEKRERDRKREKNANPHSRYFPAAKVSSWGMHMQRTNSMIVPKQSKTNPEQKTV